MHANAAFFSGRVNALARAIGNGANLIHYLMQRQLLLGSKNALLYFMQNPEILQPAFFMGKVGPTPINISDWESGHGHWAQARYEGRKSQIRFECERNK